MGLKQTRHKDVLDGSEWLRSAVLYHQKKRGGGAVASFECFLTEPSVVVANQDVTLRLLDEEDEGSGGGKDRRKRHHRCSSAVRYSYQDGGIRLSKANVRFRNSKQQLQEVHWVVKAAGAHREGRAAVQNLTHEAKVFASLLQEAHKFLAAKRNPRCKYLLNIPGREIFTVSIITNAPSVRPPQTSCFRRGAARATASL